MYGIPIDFDPSSFVGRTVEFVSFTANTVHLAFSDGHSITMESSFEHGPQLDGSPPMKFVIPVVESGLMRLVGQSVVAAEVEGQSNLLLQFDDGQTLCCLDDSAEYESFQIHCNGREIIV